MALTTDSCYSVLMVEDVRVGMVGIVEDDVRTGARVDVPPRTKRRLAVWDVRFLKNHIIVLWKSL